MELTAGVNKMNVYCPEKIATEKFAFVKLQKKLFSGYFNSVLLLFVYTGDQRQNDEMSTNRA